MGVQSSYKMAIFMGQDMPGHADDILRELCKNGWTDQDAVSVVGSDGPKDPCIRWGARSPMRMNSSYGKNMPGVPDDTAVSCAKWLNGSRCRLVCAGLGSAEGSTRYIGGTLAQPGENYWTVRMRQRCGLVSYYFDHLLLLTFYWC